ncbi:hypothetical protein L249_0578, partial [Ophiocordyceps polyrhachis-furcata BCC 54312]
MGNKREDEYEKEKGSRPTSRVAPVTTTAFILSEGVCELYVCRLYGMFFHEVVSCCWITAQMLQSLSNQVGGGKSVIYHICKTESSVERTMIYHLCGHSYV